VFTPWPYLQRKTWIEISSRVNQNYVDKARVMPKKFNNVLVVIVGSANYSELILIKSGQFHKNLEVKLV
jgi:hypothetical protein